MTRQSQTQLSPWLVLTPVIAFFLIHAVLSAAIGAPILGGDEYAYFISGKYLDRLEELYRLDPYLQRLSNLLYFKIVFEFVQFAGDGAVHALRLLHLAELVLTAFVLQRTFSGFVASRDVLLGVLAFLLFPHVVYAYTVMPETELMLLGSLLAYVMIRVYPAHPHCAGALAGPILASALLMKPHAIAMIAAAAAIMLIAPALRLVRGRAVLAATCTALMLLATYLSFVALWRICGRGWSFNPTSALGLAFYGSYLTPGSENGGFLGRIASTLSYGGAHLAVISLVFSPVLVWTATTALRVARSSGGTQVAADPGPGMAAYFVVTMLGAHIAMTAWFTGGAARSADEAMRLHGRYLGPALVVLPFLTFHAIRELRPRGEIVVKAMAVAFPLCWFLFFMREFKVFPWDYPLLFAFFVTPNHYQWTYPGVIPSLGVLLLGAVAILGVLSFTAPRAGQALCRAQIFLILLAGSAQTWTWVISHMEGTAELGNYAGAIRLLSGKGQFGKGLVVSDERYGRLPYVLFNLANAPRVVIRKEGSPLNAGDVRGVSWILLCKDYVLDFDHPQLARIGPFSYLPLTTGLALEERKKQLLGPGQHVRLMLGEGNYPASRLRGFNSQEEWGSWTAEPTAEIELPFFVGGEVQLALFGWVLPEHTGEPLRIRAGDASSSISMSDSGREYRLRLHIGQPTDRIILGSSVSHPSNSHRRMGVALSVLGVETSTPP